MRHILWSAGAVVCFASSVAAQERSAARQMLDRGRAALGGLQYLQADTIARDILSMAFLPRSARAEALELLAAANFPDAAAHQRAAEARSAISQLLSLDLALTIPPELSWHGLDSLYRDVLERTYAMSVSARRENPIVGIDGTSPLRVRANEPSTFVLRARTRDGIELIVLDSIPVATDTTLMLRVSKAGTPILRDGEYEFVVTATQVVSRETVQRIIEGSAAVPAINYVTVPSGADSASLLPERSRPQRTAGIVTGAVLATATIALGAALRAGDPIRGSARSDARYVGVGVIMGLAAGTAAWFDKGRVLDKNVASNRQASREMASRAAAAREENARRGSAYRASIILNPEAR